ncbi:FecCD family ABC transporter permease [Bacillus alkalicellulosilyticus]|uniref:FecCD family ABC transporter permease n=1 Tax=Alkalihalobacterium alkalicellulosilyticum TaxID=1912214 RepID=UPI00099710D3|nr:iron ABC transporter permease [Bacillus alkalicellulosilyticus]
MRSYHVRTKNDTISFLVEKSSLKVIFMLVAFSVMVFSLALSVGSTWLSPYAVFSHLVGIGSGEHDYIIHTLRLPRVLTAFLVGAALAVSGLILQGIVRNPLASPDIIGVTGGASVGAITFIITLQGTVSITWLPLAAILGAAIVSACIYALSWKNGITPFRLILIGIGIAAATKALTMMLLVMSEIGVASKVYIWLTGSVYGASWQNVWTLLPWVVICIMLTLLLARVVNAKELGDDVSQGLGVSVQKFRFLLLVLSVALAGAAVSVAGGIGFVGLIAPHIARKLIGRSFGSLIPASALIGGLLVVIADIIARTAFLPLDIPAGVFTAAIGAPFFIYLLFRKKNM